MFRVLLVDDEILALQYLENLIDWKALGFEVAGTATSADRALALAQTQKPHLVISDIRMPHHDGLYLCEKLTAQNAAAKMLLLSAYPDFTYAKRAFAYGVSNYILKHELSPESLTEELEKIRRELVRVEEAQRLFREKVLEDILFGSVAGEEAEKLLGPGGRFSILLLRRDRPFALSYTALPQKPQNAFRACLEHLSEQGDIQYVADMAIDDQHHLILLADAGRVSGKGNRESMHNLVLRLRKDCADECETLSAVFLGSLLYSELAAAFKRCSHALRHGVFYGRSFFGELHELPICNTEPALGFRTDFDLIRSALGKKKTYASIVETMFEKVERPSWNLSALRELCTRFLQLFSDEDTALHARFETELNGCYTLRQIRESVLNMLEELSKNKSDSVGYSSLVQRALRYIHENYRENITLETLGATLGVHGNYLGQRIKDEAGMTFLKYLTSVRMARAKELLSGGDHNVAEVAELVGYKTSQYFGTIFKSAVGVTPHEYKTSGRYDD